MTDPEFDILFEAARLEEEANIGRDLESDFVDVALKTHNDLWETRCLELQTRGSITEAERRQIEAMQQALLCYAILNARRHGEMAVEFGRATDLADATTEQKSVVSHVLTQTFASLVRLDEVASMAQQTLADLGLPASIREFVDQGGRIKVNYPLCVLASDQTCRRLLLSLEEV